MDDAQFSELAAWITEAGLAGQTEAAMVTGFCERAIAMGIPFARAVIVIDTLHPIYEGRVFSWRHETQETTLVEYGRSDEGETAERWRSSPFYQLLEAGEPFLRRRLTAEADADFPVLKELRDAGMTDYVAMVKSFVGDGVIGDMDCFYASWATDTPDGFRDADINNLLRLMPVFALAMKSTSLARIARTLVETYLGRDAGRRVLSGRIRRGVTDWIDAVLWFSDLRGYTRISDTAAPGEIIPLLNDYAETVISAIHEQGGDVLKLIGDGILAIFTAPDRSRACRAALAAADTARRGGTALSRRRGDEGLPTSEMYLGLHVGEVFYGNIGSADRLDFTVVGPAVNEVSRIAALCRSVDQKVLISSAFATAIGGADGRLVSVGRYALRGVGRPQDLFTLDPAEEADES